MFYLSNHDLLRFIEVPVAALVLLGLASGFGESSSASRAFSVTGKGEERCYSTRALNLINFD
jgi:hypothetical protein